MTDRDDVRALLEALTGERAPFPDAAADDGVAVLSRPSDRLGYSQLNELLLLYGFDRITHAFFRFLLDGKTDYTTGDAFGSIEQLREGVKRFRRLALLFYGNVTFAFKSLSRDEDLLCNALAGDRAIEESDFAARHKPILPPERIPPEDAYLTGYLIEREIKKRLDNDPANEDVRELETRRVEVVARAKKNHRAYLASDHLDVYVATSMREEHEFRSVARLVGAIFSEWSLRDLNLRYFDPTQAYCAGRIDKGLAEALMLRRATCTIYLAQESDTLGKDSELASTLAQGKPVVAYVPVADENYADAHLSNLCAVHPERTAKEHMLDQLRVFEPVAAWRDPQIRSWCQDPSGVDEAVLRRRLTDAIGTHYDKRAETLKTSHPLGIQVNLETGVANGVLVVRSVADCAELVKRIVTRTLELDLQDEPGYTVLREKVSGCIFRVMTSDAMLTNSFWNFYLDPAE